MSLSDVKHIAFVGRIKHAFKAFYDIITNRPIICVFSDSSIFARSTPAYMKVAACALDEAADTVVAEEILDGFRELIEIPEHRNN